MPETLASGHAWQITEEDGKTLLLLKSEYGTIEVKTRTILGAELITAILENYRDLKKQGPIEQAVQP